MLLLTDGPDAVLQLGGDEHTHNVRPVTQHLVGPSPDDHAGALRRLQDDLVLRLVRRPAKLGQAVGKNLGRETFITPVRWEDEWPLFTPDTGRVEGEYAFPKDLPWMELPAGPERDCFEGEVLSLDWAFWGTPYKKFWALTDEGLIIRCLPQALADPLKPMSMGGGKDEAAFVPYIARRRRQPDCLFRCKMAFAPEGGESAGIAVTQAMNHQVHLQLAQEGGQKKIQLLLFTADYALPPYIPGFTSVTNRTLIAEVPWEGGSVVLQMEMRENDYCFSFGADEDSLTELGRVDGALINPEKVGCMVGEMLGMFATGNGIASENKAIFRWAEYKNL